MHHPNTLAAHTLTFGPIFTLFNVTLVLSSTLPAYLTTDEEARLSALKGSVDSFAQTGITKLKDTHGGEYIAIRQSGLSSAVEPSSEIWTLAQLSNDTTNYRRVGYFGFVNGRIDEGHLATSEQLQSLQSA